MSGVGLGGGSWVGSGAGGGVSNAANVGAGGVGPFDSLSAGVLNFKTINAGSNKITITDDLVNKEVDIDVDEAQVDVRNLKNVSPGGNGTFAAWSDTGTLSAAPGWSFDDTGALRVGALDSLTVPAGVTDYLTMTVGPTVTNPGLTNLTGLQINPAINQNITQFSGFQIYGFGTAHPTTSTSFLSNPNWAGTTTTLTHFQAGGAATSTNATGFAFNPNATAASVKAFSATPQGSISGQVVGLEIIPTTSSASITGISVDLTGATSTGRPAGVEVDGGTLLLNVNFSTTSSFPALVDSGNIIRPVFEVASGSPISGTDVILSNLSGFMDVRDNMSYSALELGAVSVGFVSQVAVASGKTLAKASMCLGALSVEGTSAGGTLNQAHIFNATAVNFGGTLTITNLYGYHMEPGSSANATNTWGVCIEDDGAENYFSKSIKIGNNGSKTVADSAIGLEIGSAKSLRLGRVTTVQKEAMTDLTGLFVYDTTLAAPYYNDGTQWLQVAVGPARILTASATLDFPNIGSNAFADLTVSVPGAALSDVVSLGIPNAVTGTHLLWTCWVSAADVVTVRATNPAVGAHNPPSGLFKIMITQF
jgi:hypothetical protein